MQAVQPGFDSPSHGDSTDVVKPMGTGMTRTQNTDSTMWIAASLGVLLLGSYFGWALKSSSTEDHSKTALEYRMARQAQILSQIPPPAHNAAAGAPTKKFKPKEKPKAKPTTKPNLTFKRPLPTIGAGGALPPIPLSGSLMPAEPAGLDVVTEKKVDLHELEAKVRVVAMGYGATVKSVQDASGDHGSARTVILSVDQRKAKALAAKVRSRLGDNAMVGEPHSDASAADDDASSELHSEQAALEELKEQLRKGEISFYPDAPALKSIREQYTEQLAKVAKIRSTMKTPMELSVVLTG